MFMFHIALSLCLIALAAGSALYVFSAGCEGKGTCLAKLLAIFIIILSIASSLCTMYYGVKSWQQGNNKCQMCTKHEMVDENKSTNMNDKADADKDKKSANKH